MNFAVEARIKVLENAILCGKETKIIGEMLVEFFETEKALDTCISIWFFPFISERIDILTDNIILYTPLGKKLDFAKEYTLLKETTIKKFRKIADRRNSITHRRTENQRPGKVIIKSEKDKFINDCRTVRDEIDIKTKEHLEELKNITKKNC